MRRALVALSLVACVQTNTAGEVVTSVRRTSSGDLRVERCSLDLKVTYILFPVGVEAVREGCAEKVIP